LCVPTGEKKWRRKITLVPRKVNLIRQMSEKRQGGGWYDPKEVKRSETLK